MSKTSRDLKIQIKPDLNARSVVIEVRNIVGEEIAKKLTSGKLTLYDYVLLGGRKDSFSFWESGGYGGIISCNIYDRLQANFWATSSELLTLEVLDEILAWFIKQPQFIQAAYIDSTFTNHQNTKQVGISKVAQVQEPDFPIISTGLPCPMDKEYDTTGNPGYSRYHGGYREEVAAFMWLSKTFLERSGADRDEVFNTPWLETKVLDNDVIELKAWEHCFDSTEEPQRNRQLALRHLLYPKAVSEREMKAKANHETPEGYS